MSTSVGAIVLAAAIGITLFVLYQATKPKKSPTIERLKAKIAKIDPKYAFLNIREGERSETEDKSLITLCVKDPDTGKEYPDNTLIYVALHEVAHTLNKPQFSEHGSEWQGIFTKLLEKAEEAGIYSTSIPLDEVYCGINTTGSIQSKVHHKRIKVGRGVNKVRVRRSKMRSD